MTEYRNEPVTETVPSTIYENVMVDEGSYQTVWVPRLTTRSVARTVYQTRTSYRTVPYQVTRRISEYGTQTLPYQTVRHYPVTTPGAVYGALPYSYSAPSTIAASSIVPGPSVPVVSSTNSIAPTPIVPRTASADERFGGVPSGSNGPSLFAPAPSAAQAWRSAARNSAIR
jgi:hypothetical protein